MSENGGISEIMLNVSAMGIKIIKDIRKIMSIKNLIIAPISREIILVIKLFSLVESPGVVSTNAVFLYGAKKVRNIAGSEK